MNSKDLTRNQFIMSRIQCLQDQKREQSQYFNQHQNYIQESSQFSNIRSNGYNSNNSNQPSTYGQFQNNNWDEQKQIREYMLTDNKENETDGNKSQHYFNINQSQNIKQSIQESQEYFQTPVEKRISMKPEIYAQGAVYSEDSQLGENQQMLSHSQRQQQSQQQQQRVAEHYERVPSMYTYMQNSNDENDQDYEEQYDYINEQEYEKMMQEIEERETKGRVSSNTFENYQLFKPSFHEEIIKKNAHGKNISSFSKKCDNVGEQQLNQIQQQQQQQQQLYQIGQPEKKNFFQEKIQINEDLQENTEEQQQNEIDDIIFFPQNFSTFNQNGGTGNNEKKETSLTNEYYNMSNSTFNQRSQSQHQQSQRNNNKSNNNSHINIQNNHNNSDQRDNKNMQGGNPQYFSNQSQQSQQDGQNHDNTFQTTLFQNSFSQLQQQSQLNTSQCNQIEKKNFDMPLQSNLMYAGTNQQTEKPSKGLELDRKFVPTNLNILGAFDQSSRKESSRYPENQNTEGETEGLRYRMQSAHQPSTNYQNTSDNKNNTTTGYKPTQFTQFFLGNTSNNIASTDKTMSTCSQDQQPTSRNTQLSERGGGNVTDRTLPLTRNSNKDRYNNANNHINNSEERNNFTERQINDKSFNNERSIQTERLQQMDQYSKLERNQYPQNQQQSDRYKQFAEDLNQTIKTSTLRQPAQSLHQPSSLHTAQAQQLVQKYLPTQPSIQTSSNSQQNQQASANKCNYTDYQDSSLLIGQSDSKQVYQNKSTLRQYIEGDTSSIYNKSGQLPYEINTTNNDISKSNFSYQNMNDSLSKTSQSQLNNNNQNGLNKTTYRSYFNEINERSNTFYNDKSQWNNQNEDDSLNDRASQITSARPYNNISKNSNIINNISNNQISNIIDNSMVKNNNSNNNITYQLQSTSQFYNDYSQNSNFVEHSFTDRVRYNNSSAHQQATQNRSYLNQTDVQNESFNKQPLHFNLNLGAFTNDQNKNSQNSQQTQDSSTPLQPQFIQKQYQNVEKKLQLINQSKHTSFHQPQPLSTKSNQDSTFSKQQSENKQAGQQSNNSPFVQKAYLPIEDRLLQKSKEREIQKQELQKQSYIQVNEAMKKHKISAKTNALASKNDQNLSVYDRNQRFLREKEKKQLQLKEEIVQQDILYPFSPNIRPQSQNLSRNVNDLVAWKENINQKNVEMRNKQIVEEIKEMENLQNEKLICKGSERILQNSSRTGNRQKIEDKLIHSGVKYNQHKEELERIYNSNPTKNIPMINKNTFKLLLNSKKKKITQPDILKQTSSQQHNSNKSTQSPRNGNNFAHHTNGHSYTERAESTSCNKYSKEHSSTNSYNTLQHTSNSNQVSYLKEPLVANAYSIQSHQSLAKVHSNNFSSQQTLSTQQSQSQSNLLNIPNHRKHQQLHQEQDQDIFSDHSAEKGRVLQNQKFSTSDLSNVNSVKSITESKLKIKHILEQQQKTQPVKDMKQLNKENSQKNHKIHENLNIYQITSPKHAGGASTEQNGTPRYYTNESLKKSFELRQNYIQQHHNQQLSRDNSKNSNNGHGISPSSSSSNMRAKCKLTTQGGIQSQQQAQKLSVQERNKQWQEQKIQKQNLYLQQLRNEEAAQCPFRPQLGQQNQKSNSTSRSITPTKSQGTPKDLLLKTKQSYAKQFQMKKN